MKIPPATFIISCLITAFSLQTFASPQVTQKILNGKNSTINKYPFMTSLRINEYHFCGATLIRKNWAMTAAHCLDGLKNSEKLNVVINDYDLSDEDTLSNRFQEKISIEAFYIHPKFDSSGAGGEALFNNDIALIKLSASSSYEPVKLATAEDYSKTSIKITPLTMIGWGSTSTDTELPEASQILQELVSFKNHDALCRRYYGAIEFNDKMICVGQYWDSPELTQGSCYGDSGGPLLYTKDNEIIQIGITSYVAEGCLTYPSVFTKVSSHLEWINETINMNDSTSYQLNMDDSTSYQLNMDDSTSYQQNTETRDNSSPASESPAPPQSIQTETKQIDDPINQPNNSLANLFIVGAATMGFTMIVGSIFNFFMAK